jgi:hypothetical protein
VPVRQTLQQDLTRTQVAFGLLGSTVSTCTAHAFPGALCLKMAATGSGAAGGQWYVRSAMKAAVVSRDVVDAALHVRDARPCGSSHSRFAAILLWFCSGFALVLFWFCSGFVLVLFWFCSGFVLVLFWFCSGSCSRARRPRPHAYVVHCGGAGLLGVCADHLVLERKYGFSLEIALGSRSYAVLMLCISRCARDDTADVAARDARVPFIVFAAFAGSSRYIVNCVLQRSVTFQSESEE